MGGGRRIPEDTGPYVFGRRRRRARNLHAARGALGVGPYSRFGWNHPGPTYFYVLSGHREDALAFALLLILGAGLAAGHLAALPAAIVLASFVVQTHVGYLPVALCIIVTALVAWCMRSMYRQRDGFAPSSRRTQWLLFGSAAVFVAMWAMPAIAEITGPQPGNLTRLVGRFGQDHHTDVSTGLAAFAYNLSGVLLPDFEAAAGGRVLDAAVASVPARILTAGQFIALAVALIIMARRRRMFLVWQCAICLVASAVAVWACTRIGSDIVDHTVFWISMLGVVNLATLTAASLEVGATSLVAVRLPPQWIAPVLLAVLAGYGATHLWQGHHQSRFTDERIAVRELVRALDSRLGKGAGLDTAVRVDIGQGAWQIAAGVVLELYKRGEAVTVTDAWVPLFGPPMAPTGSETIDVVVADEGRHAELQRDSRFELVASERGAYLYVGSR